MTPLKLLPLIALLWACSPLQAAPDKAASAPLTAASGPWQAEGELLIDTRHGLRWRRCLEGQRWDGKTCRGEALQLSLAEAQQRARQAGAGWRLPRLKELQQLPRGGGTAAQLFDVTALEEWHWSGTAVLRTASGNPYNYGQVMRQQGQAGASAQMADDEGLMLGWAVLPASGASREQPRSQRLRARLVQSPP